MIDVETTGLFPFRHDRVIEIAAVVVQCDGRIENEFVSLVNPARDIGPSSIHGLTSEDLMHAPQFAEIAGLLLEALVGTVAIAAHNVRFDRQFLDHEFARIECRLPELPTLCTMQLSGGGQLADCCRDYGVSSNGDAHHALSDARMTAQLLTGLISDEPSLLHKLQQLTAIDWPAFSCSGKQPITRDESRRRQNERPTYLQRLLDRRHDLSSPLATDGSVMAYAALLDQILEDRRIDETEAGALVETAHRWGISPDQVESAHRAYLNQLATVAVSDGVVTDVERRDLKQVARLLGQDVSRMDDILDDAASIVATISHGTSSSDLGRDLVGMRVCFTGELQCTFHGQMITREMAEELATGAGLEVARSVTKSLDILVVADPHTQSGKAKKARQYGIRVMCEPVFWQTIGVDVN